MKHIFYILILFLCITNVRAQTSVKGVVVDAATGQPMPGTAIKWDKGTVITTETGEFSIVLSPGDYLLKLTYLNYKPKDTLIKVPLSAPLVIALSNNIREIESVEVSTGYQVLPKERSTGSFVKISNKTLNEQVSTDLISRLEGVASSFSVDRKSNSGGGYGIMIRGLSTIRGERAPLIVLDNFPYEGDINNINPNDVESITILKDAAAASIWGARAGNGVVVITTKHAQFNQRLKITFNSNVKVEQSPDLYYKPLMSVSNYVDIENMLFDKGYYSSAENSYAKPALSEVVELRIAARDGLISNEEATNRINALRQYDLREQMNKYIYQDAVSQQYALQLTGGSQKRNWLLSGGYDKNVSNLDAKASRYNLRMEQTQKFTSRLSATGRLYLTHDVSGDGKPGITNLSSSALPMYTRIADDNGNALPVIRNYRFKYLQTAGNGKLLDWYYYPLNDYQSVDTKNILNNVLATISADYKIIEGLKASVSYQYQQQEQNTNIINGTSSYNVRNVVNQFSQIDAGGNVKRIIPLGGIHDVSGAILKGYNARAQVDFSRTFTRHAISAIAGAEVRSNTTDNNQYRLYGVQEATQTTSLVDYINPYPNFVTGYDGYIENADELSGRTNRFVSLYANAAYTYDTRYTLSLSARRDASNLYGLNTNDKWNPLFSAGVSWNISNEKFFHADAIPYLKLRATFGASGNTNDDMVAITTLTYQNNSSYTKSPMATFNNYYNPELKWERVYMFNAGLDFSLKNNRLTGSIEYYHKKAVDLFGDDPLDPTVGIGLSIVKNTSTIAAKGIDIELNSINIKGKFSWESSFFMNFYKDKVLKNYKGTEAGHYFINGNISSAGLPGKPVYAIFSYKWAGLDPQTGDPRGFINGVPSNDYNTLTGESVLVSDLNYHGPAFPAFNGALGNTFTYGPFSLNFRLTYKFGYYFVKSSIDYTRLYSFREANGDFEKRWQKPGDELITNVPSMVYPAVASRDAFYSGSSVNIDKGDHIRLQYVNIAYQLKLKEGNKLRLSALQFYAVASNLGILWRANKDHIDPDYPDIPASKNIAVGLRANF